MEFFILIAVIALILIMWFSIKPDQLDHDEDSRLETVKAEKNQRDES